MGVICYDFDLDHGALTFDCENWTMEIYGNQAARLLPSITKAFTNVVG